MRAGHAARSPVLSLGGVCVHGRFKKNGGLLSETGRGCLFVRSYGRRRAAAHGRASLLDRRGCGRRGGTVQARALHLAAL